MWSIGGMSKWVTVLACVMAHGCVESGPDPRILSEPLRVDAEFDTEQQAAVQAAVDLWSDATGGRFAPELRFAPVECGEPFAIEAVHTQGCSIGQAVELDGGRTGHVRGATDTESHSVSVAAWLAGSGFRDTVAHELGHYLLLGHGDGIMAQPADRHSDQVSPASVNEFCTVWGC
jgi:hypothetical protein